MSTALIIGGGQSGLAAAGALREQGFRPVVLEAGPDPAGSWPRYYDSLTLFTPAWFNQLPGMALPGDPQRYPHRDEVADYLRAYAGRLDCEVHTGRRVRAVRTGGDGYVAETEDGSTFTARAVVAATGTFDRPHRPELPGLERFAGTVLHSADYRHPGPFAGKRVVVVGGGNSAVQIAVELAAHARVSLATRKPVEFLTAEGRGNAVFWRVLAAFGTLPVAPLFGDGSGGVPVLDTGGYRRALTSGDPDRRDLFTGAEGHELTWRDGTREHVDTVILATGYRPSLDYLRPLGALSLTGRPLQHRGIASLHPGIGFVGLEGQRTVLSASIRGVAADAAVVARRLRERVG
ncbi:flavin-containing monooxygenase [Prauserella cavernicola]|uniref:NAD(P)/FAD-dependent oxidoreductase n=1 Tax=Prauserella cavernicola TaxID=2800127 RepID=A0A934QYT6_9PSEU|nr:NAD(P)/FAD-dependent oxidoreductase [Prauserella cavernicola]MBK1787763.1 NAD(P)/FAD-dependent oxidoreductase [Prauserella cavernicola]